MDELLDLDAMVDQYLGVSPSQVSSPSRFAAMPSPQPTNHSTTGSTSFASNARRLFQAAHPVAARRTPPAYADTDRSPHRSPMADNFHTTHDGPIEVQSGGHLTNRSHDAASDMKGNSTLRRIQLWAERRDAKRAIMVYEQLQEEVKECTFHPARETVSNENSSQLAPSSLYMDNKAWGYDEFVDRLICARAAKERRQAEDEERMSGATGRRWTPEPTVPEPFEFARFNRRAIASLKKPFDVIAPALRDEHYSTLSTIEAPSVPSGLFSVRPSRVIIEHASPSSR